MVFRGTLWGAIVAQNLHLPSVICVCEQWEWPELHRTYRAAALAVLLSDDLVAKTRQHIHSRKFAWTTYSEERVHVSQGLATCGAPIIVLYMLVVALLMYRMAAGHEHHCCGRVEHIFPTDRTIAFCRVLNLSSISMWLESRVNIHSDENPSEPLPYTHCSGHSL